MGTAFALVLIIEGVMPFLSPDALRKAYAGIIQMDDRWIRGVGFGSMLLGLIVLQMVTA